jgi:glucose-1-phosphate cytidylyltransferase
MKSVILCGGLGTRLSEETDYIPKPMVKIGKKPIVHHIMEIYRKFDVRDFYLSGGYKVNKIKEYYLNLNIDTKKNISIDFKKKKK